MKRPTSINTFLVEIIIVILFFSLCVGITLQLFVNSHIKNKLNSDMNMALIIVQTKAEEFKQIETQEDYKQLYKTTSQYREDNKDVYSFYFDENWKQTQNPSVYIIKATVKEEIIQTGEILSVRFEAKKIYEDNKNPIIEIETGVFLQPSI